MAARLTGHADCAGTEHKGGVRSRPDKQSQCINERHRMESLTTGFDTRRRDAGKQRTSGTKTRGFNIKPLCLALVAAGILSACGGGGGGTSTAGGSTTSPSGQTPGDTTGGNTGGNTGGDTGGNTGGTSTTAPLPAAVPTTASMVMSCVDGTNYQCSGGTLIRTDNGVALTSSGVQAYGRSTNDLATPIVVKTSASGFAPASGGLAEIRIAKDANGVVSSPALLLSNLGLSWDGSTERPLIIETFNPTQGRTTLNGNGAVTSGALPANSDLTFYNYASLGANGTQANYANNRYFPRTGNPSRCGADMTTCPTTETSGIQYSHAGNWQTGGNMPDIAAAVRLHEDGDIHAGDGPPDANGQPTVLIGGNGPGVPFPGSKGYRGFDNWSLQYANLGAWVSQDTVLIEEWAHLGNEHNKNRRGVVTYGDVTTPATIPTSGTASYSGIAYGWYTANPNQDPNVFRGPATVTANFATRQVTIKVENAVTYDQAGTAVPVNFTTTVGMGAAGSNVANYLTGTVSNSTFSGGISGRYFGPVAGAAGSAGPAEAGGSFTMSNANSGAFAVGGFLVRKQ